MSARIAPAWLSAPPTRALLAALAPARPLFVGGCVRDALLGREAQDVDLCVSVPPEDTVALLEAAGLRAAPTGVDHGTVTAIVEGRGYEVTTLRRDVETFGRRARVAFTESVAEDAARRDFTLNALYADGDGAVIDPLGGLDDLRAGRVRFIGEAAERIAEDYLRILRFFRFTAWFSRVGVDAQGEAACAEAREGLSRIARERIGHETRRLLAAPDPSEAVAAMARAGVLDAVLPGARVAILPKLVAAESAAGEAPSWLRRLAALAAEREGEGAPERVAERLRLSRAEARTLRAVAEARALGLGPEATAHLASPEAARDAALIAAAEAGAPPPGDLAGRVARGAAASFPLRARDLIAAGVAQGPELGATLARLRRLWAEQGFAPGRAELLEAAAAQSPKASPQRSPNPGRGRAGGARA